MLFNFLMYQFWITTRIVFEKKQMSPPQLSVKISQNIPTYIKQTMGYAHHLDEVNMWPKFHENPSSHLGDMERTRNKASNLWPSSMTLTLTRDGRDMGSAHCLDEVNIWPKFHESPLSRLGDMSRHDFRQTDRRTDRRSDGQTDTKDKNNISPLYTGRDIIPW